MPLVFSPEPGVVELRWMWLPMFIAQDIAFMDDLRRAVEKEFLYEQVSDKRMFDLNCFVKHRIADRYKEMPGLLRLLDAIDECCV